MDIPYAGTLALLEQPRDGTVQLILDHKLRRADEQVPTPLFFGHAVKSRPTLAAPVLPFELADRVILLSGEFSGHFDGKRRGVECPDLLLKGFTAGSALTADGQVGGVSNLEQRRFVRGSVLGFV